MNAEFDAGAEARRLDKLVGERIRKARILAGLTQHDLAEKLKLSYQQIQKYETGSNRLSAGRLAQIASFLGYDVTWFYQGSPLAELPHGGQHRPVIELIRHYEALEPRLRSAVSALLRELAETPACVGRGEESDAQQNEGALASTKE